MPFTEGIGGYLLNKQINQRVNKMSSFYTLSKYLHLKCQISLFWIAKEKITICFKEFDKFYFYYTNK